MGKNKNTPSLRRIIIATWRTLTHDLFDTYHPERHYMRGPGPAWRAKHGQTVPATGFELSTPAVTAVHA